MDEHSDTILISGQKIQNNNKKNNNMLSIFLNNKMLFYLLAFLSKISKLTHFQSCQIIVLSMEPDSAGD